VTDTDAIVNFAAETHVDRSIEDSAQFLSTGVMGVHCLLEAVRTTSRVGATRRPIRFVHVSTDEVYGSVENGSSTEDAQLRPRSPYSAAKAAGDLLILAYHETYGLDVAITRGANTYGPYQYPEKLIPLFITNAIENSPLPLYGDGEQRRDWLFVDDHADAIAAVVDRGTAGGVYNVPAGEERANREVAVEILKRLSKPWSLVRHVADRPGHDRRYAMDGSHIASLGWSPTTTFDHGLDATVAWFKANRDWWMASRTEDWDAYYRRTYTSRLAEAGAGNQVG
jgi:dTDP-glucose 4,6-dehydratase